MLVCVPPFNGNFYASESYIYARIFASKPSSLRSGSLYAFEYEYILRDYYSVHCLKKKTTDMHNLSLYLKWHFCHTSGSEVHDPIQKMVYPSIVSVAHPCFRVKNAQ